MKPATALQTRFLSSLADIDAGTWDALAGPGYPFLRHAFLYALEASGCTTRQSGWQPHHLLVYDHSEEPLALLPLYLKYNSMGEYVFDWSWADAYRQHGMRYYPKLLSAIPFTPCSGPRLCVKAGMDDTALLPFIVTSLREEAEKHDASGLHLLFPEPELSRQLIDHDCLQRLGCQYQWFNRGYPDFTTYLQSFNSRKRKNIRKEREKIRDAGITFTHLRGQEISAEHWQTFFSFYQNTYFVRGREPYLNPDFFTRLGESMPDSLLLVLARSEDRHIAGALSFIGSDTLYGRYWGSLRDYQFLHFETCYYQGIDFCLANGLKRFDSGAQGEHKIQRGFEPVPTWSNHWLAHPGFHEAIDSFLDEEERYLKRYITHAGTFLPFRKEE